MGVESFLFPSPDPFRKFSLLSRLLFSLHPPPLQQMEVSTSNPRGKERMEREERVMRKTDWSWIRRKKEEGREKEEERDDFPSSILSGEKGRMSPGELERGDQRKGKYVFAGFPLCPGCDSFGRPMQL